MNAKIIKEQKKYIEKTNEINKNKNLKYNILTMGCKLNENDSEKLIGMIEKMGYKESKTKENSELYIINTCCVRENSEEKLFGKLGELKQLKEKNDSIIAIGGCMMQEKHIVEKLNKSYPFIDIIFGTHTLFNFPKNLYKIITKKNKIKDIIDIKGEIYEEMPIKRNNNKKALVTIMYGCNNFCSYCIVPYVRGRERSRKAKDILNEIKNLAKEGYKEIILLGQNVNSYMKFENNELEEINSFAKLLIVINKIEGIETIRFLSAHPKDFTDDVIDAIKECEKVSRLIHIPLQSGSTKILENMNRKYTKEQYLELIKKIKKQIPEVVFSTDIIIGFPGETEDDFEETLDVIKKVEYEQTYMFIYSKRVGTPAIKMKNQVDEKIKHKRFNKLKLLCDSQTQESNIKYLGTIQKVLVEGNSKKNEKMLTGRTDTNKVVIFEGSLDLIEKIINIKIISEHKWYLKGEVVNE